MPAELWLVRHGETAWSIAGRHTGTTDLPLTENGRAAAEAAGRRLGGIEFARVVTSPLARARETCSLAGFGERAEILAELAEWNYGEDEGVTTAAIRETRPGWTIWTHGPRGGESREQVASRADRTIAGIRRVEGRTLAFCHGHFSRVLAARWIGLPLVQARHLRLETAAISVLGWERETAAIRLWNDTGKLPD
ncbi:MAG TPA: histidine phosphatase family protein [Candidatus Limnocylindrales bacterium]|nr:histidine phosphatase family protein [Candidatus Limnocylindrales bacterium]